MAPNVLWIQTMASNPCRKTQLKLFFGGHTKNRSSCSLWEKICGQKAHKNFSGKFGEIREKIHPTLENLPAPTPVQGAIRDSSSTLHIMEDQDPIKENLAAVASTDKSASIVGSRITKGRSAPPEMLTASSVVWKGISKPCVDRKKASLSAPARNQLSLSFVE